MKRSIITTLLVTATVAIGWIAPAKAEDFKATFNPVVNRTEYIQVQPFNLISLGYQGYFSNQGIPSYGAFSSRVKTGDITGLDLVEIAVSTGKLPNSALNDQQYINQVQNLLTHFVNN